MSAKIFRLPPEVLNVLARSDTDGNRLELPEQLDRKLYVQVAKALDAIGCKWNKRDKSHFFANGTDAEQAIDSLMVSGQVHLPSTFDFFRTPLAVLEALAEHGDIVPGLRVLEPSAGDGAIAVYMDTLGCQVDCIELTPDKAAKLRRLNFQTEQADFLTVAPRPVYDRVVMNPPFSKCQEASHVMHALSFLKPGGRLVSVMSAAISFREQRKYQAVRTAIESAGGYIELLPAGSFRESGTDVNTCIVSIGTGETVVDSPARVPDTFKAHAPAAFELTPRPY